MAVIHLDKVTFGYTNTLFEDITLLVENYDRIGIVGSNGSGKTTLLKCMAGLIEPTDGKVNRASKLKFGMINQDISKDLYNISFDNILSSAIPKDEFYSMAWKIEETFDYFKTPSAIRQKPMKELSGGWQRLALIARAVLESPDVLLLDEPTNHLDINKIILLEKWLNEQIYDIPLITISHDRNFLDSCTNKTVFLRGTSISEYSYPYSKAQVLLNEDCLSASIKMDKEIKKINRLKKSAHELRQVGVNNYSAAALKKSIQINKRAEKIESQLVYAPNINTGTIKLSNSDMQSRKIIELNNININSKDGNFLFHITDFSLMNGERAVIFGKNGSGKSHFLKYLHQLVIDREKNITNPNISISPAIKLGYTDQNLSQLPLDCNVRDYIHDMVKLDITKVISILVSSGFSVTNQTAKLRDLSYGMRARIAFLTLHLLEPNFYIMDEPTNHLDIPGQEQLESEILKQNAASVIVSHDRVFTKNIGTKFYMIQNGELIQIESPDNYINPTLRQ